MKFIVIIADIDQLCAEGRISGSVQGRQDKAVFVPDIYSKTQTSWIDDFFKQNGYIGKKLTALRSYQQQRKDRLL